ncbi:MAG: CMP-N,N'-diacetyllegionaminic acid synthase [Paracoccaceae bacterium]|jgi:CMP-N,N'-diacetyllegionaminic acid synthase
MLIIVPARVGSKGFPGKNILPFCGFSLIEWSLSAALYLQKNILGATVQVTTDCPKVSALVVQKYSKNITLRPRPEALASDTAEMSDVVLDGANFAGIGNRGRYLLLQPTSPLRLLSDLDSFASIAQNAGSQVSCTVPVEDPHDLTDLASKLPVINTKPATRRQDRRASIRFVDGSLYAGNLAQLAATRSFMPTGQTQFHSLNIPHAVDIDTPLDWHMSLALHDWLCKEGINFVRPTS